MKKFLKPTIIAVLSFLLVPLIVLSLSVSLGPYLYYDSRPTPSDELPDAKSSTEVYNEITSFFNNNVVPDLLDAKESFFEGLKDPLKVLRDFGIPEELLERLGFGK